MPNMWKLYEETQANQGIPSLAAPIRYVYAGCSLEVSQSYSHIASLSCHPVDTVLHPRNLNLVFVAYSGWLEYMSLSSIFTDQ